MNRVFFFYSEMRPQDKDLVRSLKNWLPTNIDIIVAGISTNKIETLDEKINAPFPKVLIGKELPIFITEDAYIKLLVSESAQYKGSKLLIPLMYDMECARQLISGRLRIEQFILQLQKPYKN